MNNSESIAKALRLLESAQASINSAYEILGSLDPNAVRAAAPRKLNNSASTAYENGDQQIVEGVFDGQKMLGPDDKTFPVPANYASKSKLLQGDRLKLTILPNGSFLYKQISPIERKHVKGTLVKEDGQFRVDVDGKLYKVLLASVTYFKGEAGDEVTLIVANDDSGDWGAIEAIIPQMSSDMDHSNSF